MLKLISLNIEGPKHYSTVFPFITQEKTDVLCLQEAPEEMRQRLQAMGYNTSFAPMFIHNFDEVNDVIGIMIASKLPQKTHLSYYWKSTSGIITKLDSTNLEATVSNVYLLASIKDGETEYNIATTHGMNTGNGTANKHQATGFETLLESLSKEPSHIICGDFNMPRGYNHLYKNFIQQYKDEIPNKYKSSLNKNLHRLGKIKIDQPIFADFMVDYIFSKPDYRVTETRLEFGISDHAAIVANIARV